MHVPKISNCNPLQFSHALTDHKELWFKQRGSVNLLADHKSQAAVKTLARANNPAVSATCSGDTDVTTAAQGPSQPS